ncbi:MAG: hypothetical protein AAB395_04000 [Patescibacteria group bacterium]
MSKQQSQNTSKKQSDKGLSNSALYVFLALFATIPMGLIGAFFGYKSETSNAISGFLWGIGIAVALSVFMIIGYLGWEWVKKEADEGKMRPYMLCGLLVAIAISGWFAWGLGEPTCIEQSDDPVRSSCIDYADDDFEVTAGQRWEEFWSKLPVTLIICLLIAYIAHSGAEKNRSKYFKSEEDGFSVSIFPETIKVIENENTRLYQYKLIDYLEYAINVIPLEASPQSKQDMFETIKSWQKDVMTDVVDSDAKKLSSSSSGTRQRAPFVYVAYEEKDGTTYHSYAYLKYGKIYDLYMFTSKNKGYNGHTVFFEFVDSFRFIRNQ